MINEIVLCIIFIIVIFIIYVNVKRNNKDKKKKLIKEKKNKKKQVIKKPIIKKPIIKKPIVKKPIIKKPREKVPEFVYLTIEINNENVGNIVIKLFDDIVPKTTNNFRVLCKTKKYASCPFHRIIKDFMIQGGDYTQHNGRGGQSIYGTKFEDENFILKHDRPYLLSMANSGPDTNGSQFFITTSPTPHLDGIHVIFGEVIEGFDIIYKLNNADTNNDDTPNDKIIISDSGTFR
jgi:cyclophilin family peptidyl-prolyl cis-trans isomerase